MNVKRYNKRKVFASRKIKEKKQSIANRMKKGVSIDYEGLPDTKLSSK